MPSATTAPPRFTRRDFAALFVLLAFIAWLCTGCSLQAEYIKADRATYNAVAPRQARYIEADETLTADQKDEGLTTLKTWDLRLRKAEKKK